MSLLLYSVKIIRHSRCRYVYVLQMLCSYITHHCLIENGNYRTRDVYQLVLSCYELASRHPFLLIVKSCMIPFSDVEKKTRKNIVLKSWVLPTPTFNSLI